MNTNSQRETMQCLCGCILQRDEGTAQPWEILCACEAHGGDMADKFVTCERCGNTWDTLSPCALCNATRGIPST